MRRGSRPPAFQFYPTDWLADANVCQMTFHERGIYITLLCHCWLEGSIPGEPDAIMELLRIAPDRFTKAWDRILMARFVRRPDGRFQHWRLELQRQASMKFRESRILAGRLGNEKRWGHGSHSDRTAIAQGDRTAIANGRSPVSSLHKEQVAAPPRRGVSLEARAVAKDLGAAIRGHMPQCRELQSPEAAYERWARDIDLAMRLDGRTELELTKAIDWCHRSPEGAFWRANILSGKKLREKYDTIAAQMARPKSNGTAPHVVATPVETGRNIPRDLPPEKRIGEVDAKAAMDELRSRLRYKPEGEEP